MLLLSSTACAPRRRHLDLKVGFIHCVLFHLQSIALMSPLVSQLISMDAPETSSHTFSVTFDGFSVCLLFPTKAKKKKNKTLDGSCWTHLPRRSGCKGWSTSGYTAAGRTSQSPRDASSPDWPVLGKPALPITWIAFTLGKRSVAAYPLVDGVVLAVVELLVEVEDPQGRAGVEVVVVKHAVNCDVLPRTHHHFFRDVAHLCKHTHCFEDNVIVNWRKRIKTDARLIFLENKVSFWSSTKERFFFCPNLSDHFQNKCDSTWMMKWKKALFEFPNFCSHFAVFSSSSWRKSAFHSFQKSFSFLFSFSFRPDFILRDCEEQWPWALVYWRSLNSNEPFFDSSVKLLGHFNSLPLT